MKAFNSILMIADGAPGERKALDYAVDLAVHQQARLVVMDITSF